MLPTLTTKRLVLRPIQKSDAEAIAALGGKDFEVARWLTGCSWPYIEGDAETFVADVMAGNPFEGEAAFAMTLGGIFIGVIAIEAPGELEQQPECPSLGYWIGRSFQGFGYTSEAARAVLDWAFAAYDCQAIAARAYEENTASRALLRRQGFRPVGMTERFAKPLDRKVSCVVVRLERDDFEARRVAA